MTQKVLKVGDSMTITIPKKSLKELGLRPGDKIKVEKVGPSTKLSKRQQKIAELSFNFINRYRKDLESLARK